ncbi:GNAT family N-acetyltransferase [Aurantimonas sp. C2-6-R+9]|uniref:GNAT family N-acetyltransferase n=1 Tax=unclassified Aurantimonas TaxID=2638230 RepID=UPI002E180207|nr:MULTISPECIES: GNAT family N-acetyltransferase [unclassified Aurantimonas]MEC5289729.1 GNAT family N-acetyltransferase [Aurantimonas sp. C2-3-R2]MEC5379695.1 GNAT family N-acetyltransferase [Aurantimonas sp. C2-6-R+9]MEC5410834.1 GNAT family N-acetyltransferase [Aurantimonas sp. C2-4-R8]
MSIVTDVVAANIADKRNDARPDLMGGAGSPVHVRRVRAHETDLFLSHLQRLPSETRRLRFGNAVNDTFLESYARLALGPDSLVKGLFADGELRGVAELRFLTGSHDEAEGAFSIEPEFQGHGHGDRLFGRLVAAARNRGVRRIFLTCLRENHRMQAIAAKHGADLSFIAGDVTAEILRPYADAKSLAREWADESEAYVFAMIEERGRRLRFFTEPLRRLAASFVPQHAPH